MKPLVVEDELHGIHVYLCVYLSHHSYLLKCFLPDSVCGYGESSVYDFHSESSLTVRNYGT